MMKRKARAHQQRMVVIAFTVSTLLIQRLTRLVIKFEAIGSPNLGISSVIVGLESALTLK